MVSIATATSGPQATPPLVSLLTSVRVTEDTDGHVAQGITWEPEACGTVADSAGVCASPSTLPAVPANAAPAEARPFLVTAADRCSTFAREQRDPQGRVLRLLAATQHRGVESELWDGTVAQSEATRLGVAPSPYLRNPATVVDLTPATGAVRPTEALALLERALGQGYAGRGVIHASIRAAYYLPDTRLDGQVWLTKRNTVVVPGAGYSGLGPVGTPALATNESWLFATGMVDVHLGEVYTTGTDLDIDRDTNTVVTRALRSAVALFDPCAHYAVRMLRASAETTPAA